MRHPIARILCLAPALILPLVICPWSFDSFELPKLLVLRLLLVLALGAVMLSDDRERKLPCSSLHLPVVLLFCAFGVATVVSPLPQLSLTGGYQSYMGLLRFADTLILYLLAVVTMRGSNARHGLFTAVTISAFLVALHGILQYLGYDFGHWDISEEAGTSALRYRSFATMGSPSFLGLFLAISLPLGMAGLSGAEKRHDQWVQTIVLVTIVVCLVLTFSRAAWIGAVAGVIIYLCFINNAKPLDRAIPEPRSRKSLVVALFALSLGASIGITMTLSRDHTSAVQRVASVWETPTGSVWVRFRLWHGSLAMLAEKPFLGWGPSTIRYVFPRFAPSGMKEVERYNISAHNSFLDTALQAGGIGFIAYICVIGSTIQALRHARDKFPALVPQEDVGAIGGALGAYLAGVQFGFGSLTVELVVWLLLGCLASMVSSQREISLRRCVAAGLTGIWAILTLWTLSWFIADLYFQRGETLWQWGEPLFAMEEYSRATFWNPAQDLYWVRRGQSMDALGFSSIGDYRIAVDTNPLNAGNYAFLAQAFARNGDTEASRSAWGKALFYDPQRRTERVGRIK